MEFNFFAWIREGVKQSVLLGVSDAVEQLGAPPEGAGDGQQLLTFLKQSNSGGKVAGASSRTKRLGRSLKDAKS